MDSWNEESRMGQPSAVYQVAEAAERENPESPLLEKGDEIHRNFEFVPVRQPQIIFDISPLSADGKKYRPQSRMRYRNGQEIFRPRFRRQRKGNDPKRLRKRKPFSFRIHARIRL